MPVESILSHFWELASLEEDVRLKAASQLLCALEQAQKLHRQNIEDGEEDNSCSKELEYSVTRLVKGLASSRKGARQGFATVLTEILSELQCPTPDRMFQMIAENLEVTGSFKAWEVRDAYLGEIFGLMSLLRSQCARNILSSQNVEWLGPLITRIQDLSKKKSYLQELCAKVTVDIFGLVSTDVFIQCVCPAVKGIIESGWAQATPEILLVSLAAQRLWGDHIDKKLMEDAWKCSLIADKRNYKQLASVLLDSITAHPRVHCVWDEIFLTLLRNRPASDFKLFWKIVVEDGLFESTHERKFLGFQLVKKILTRVSADKVPVLFSGHMMRSFINSLSSSQAYLHKAAKHLASSLPAAIKQNTDTDVAFVVLKQLFGRHGSIEFDKLTNTKTVVSVVGALKGSGLKKYVSWLSDVFTNGFVEVSSEPQLSKNVESLRTSVLNQLLSLVKNKSVSHEGQWIEDVLFFLFGHSYFQPITSQLQVAITPAVKQICEQRFVSLLKELLSGKEVKEDKLSGIVHRAEELLEDKSYQVVSDLWTVEAEKAFQKAVKIVTKIQRKRKNTGTRQNENDVFGVLFSLIALHLFSDPEQARDILKELKVCYEKQKAGNNEENPDEPHWVEVLTEVLLSLLTRPSSVFRLVVDHAFSVLVPHLTRNALNIILESLDPRKGVKGETLEIVDESGDEEENGMDLDEASEKRILKNGSENGKDDVNEEDDDSDEGDSSSDDEQDANGGVDEAFRAEVQAALGPAVVDMDNEGSNSDEDLDDEAMMKLNDALAVAFKAHLKAKKDKNKKKDAMKILLHFKLRALDIVEIFIKKQGSNPLILEIIDPLLDVVWSSLNSKDFNMLGERAQSLFKNKLCSAKELPPASAVNAKDVHRKIEHLIKKAMRAPSVAIVSLVTRGCLYLVRVLRGSRVHESAAAKKRDHSGNVYLEASTQICLLDGPRIAKAFKKALKNFMLKRSSHLHPVLFTELIDRFPHLGWPLAEDLVTYLETAVNNFRKTQACLMLIQLLSKRIPDHPRHIQEIAFPMQTALSNLLTRAAESDTELKVKNIREILKLTNKFVNEARSAVQNTALLQTEVLKEALSVVLGSALAERSPDIKRSCNAILTTLSRSDVEHLVHQAPKTKKKRQRVESQGQGCPETVSSKDESEDYGISVEKRNEKKKKVEKKEQY